MRYSVFIKIYSIYPESINIIYHVSTMFKAMDDSKIRRIHMKITTLSSAGSFLDGFDISIISVAILTITSLYSLTTTEQTLLLGSTLLGMVFGGLSIGYLTDIKGRRFVFLWDMVIFILFTFLTAISLNYTQLLIFRLLLGVAIGADYAITPTIIAEFAPAKHRGKLLSFSGGAWFIGAFAAYGVGYLMPLFFPVTEAWRLMFGVGIIPAFIVLILRRDIPESPRWLVAQGEYTRAEKSMRTISRDAEISVHPRRKKTRIGVLFSKKYIAATVFISIFWFVLDAVTYVIALNGPSILAANFSLSSDVASGYAAIIAAFAIIGAVVAIIFIDRTGRKNLTVAGFAGMVVPLFVAALVFEFFPNLLFVIILFVIFEISQEVGPGITNSIYPQELYPTEIRSTAQGFGTTISRIGALFGIFTFAIFPTIALGLTYLVVLSLIGLIATIILGVETKGKSLEVLSGE